MRPTDAGVMLAAGLQSSGRTALSLAKELRIPQSSLSVMQRGVGWETTERWLRVLAALGLLDGVRASLGPGQSGGDGVAEPEG